MPMNALTPIEQRWRALAPPEAATSARALYELMPLQAGGNLPFVDVPYDPRRVDHWAHAAHVADFAAALPEGGSTVLDVGPGDGWPALPLAAALPWACVIGVDPSPHRVRVCRANAARLGLANARFVAGDAQSLPLRDASVDLAVAAHAVEECDAPEAVLAEVARVLRPGGVFRVLYQVWDLPAPVVETVTFWAGIDALLFTYTVRRQDPPLERRYVLVLPPDGEAAAAHAAALLRSAGAARAWGETLVDGPWTEAALEHLAPFARRSFVVDLHRWTTPWLLEALARSGFSHARATAHPGDLARHVARALLHRNIDAAPFDALTTAIGHAALHTPGTAMVVATR